MRRFIGGGVDEDERVDFGASDAAMRDDEMSRVRDGALLVPMTAGSVTLAYNLPGLTEDLRLTREAYVDIFLGRITSWSDRRIAAANPGVTLPKLTIATVVRQDGSGTTFAFTKHLDAISETWRAQYGASTLVDWPGSAMRASGNEGVAGRIKQSVGSIGYVSAESARHAGLRVARLQNRAGQFVAPTAESSMAALAGAEVPDNLRVYVPDPRAETAYPIVTLTWVLLHQRYADARKAQRVHELFRWCLTDGQRSASDLGYTPLPPHIVQRSLAALDRVATTATSSQH